MHRREGVVPPASSAPEPCLPSSASHHRLVAGMKPSCHQPFRLTWCDAISRRDFVVIPAASPSNRWEIGDGLGLDGNCCPAIDTLVLDPRVRSSSAYPTAHPRSSAVLERAIVRFGRHVGGASPWPWSCGSVAWNCRPAPARPLQFHHRLGQTLDEHEPLPEIPTAAKRLIRCLDSCVSIRAPSHWTDDERSPYMGRARSLPVMSPMDLRL